MSDETKEQLSMNDLLKNSSLYREFQAEREEILKHKWIESEKGGRDIGFERELTDWIIKNPSIFRLLPHLERCLIFQSGSASPKPSDRPGFSGLNHYSFKNYPGS